MNRVYVTLLGLLLLWGLLACSTTKGTLLDKAAESDKKESAIKSFAKEEDEEEEREETGKPAIQLPEISKETQTQLLVSLFLFAIFIGAIAWWKREELFHKKKPE